jgi:tRNA-modifying protein YgfZ
MATEALPELDAQYRLIREEAGILDRSGRGKLRVSGTEAAEFLQGQLTNDIEGLEAGEGCYCALLDRKGHIQADARVLRISGGELWLDTEPEARQALHRHLDTYKIGRDVELADVSQEWAILSLLGPASAALAAVSPGPEHSHGETEAGGAAVRWVLTDLGIDLILPAADAQRVRSHFLGAGAAEISEAAAEIARVESGRPRFGREMSSATMPAEAGIVERAVDFEKGCYIGQEPVARLHYRGRPNRVLRGLRLSTAAEAGEELFLGDKAVGAIGTACVSPALGPVALAVVRREAEPGASLRAGEGAATVTVVELPFRDA